MLKFRKSVAVFIASIDSTIRLTVTTHLMVNAYCGLYIHFVILNLAKQRRDRPKKKSKFILCLYFSKIYQVLAIKSYPATTAPKTYKFRPTLDFLLYLFQCQSQIRSVFLYLLQIFDVKITTSTKKMHSVTQKLYVVQHIVRPFKVCALVQCGTCVHGMGEGLLKRSETADTFVPTTHRLCASRLSGSSASFHTGFASQSLN